MNITYIILVVIAAAVIFLLFKFYKNDNKNEGYCGRNCPTLSKNLGYCIRRNAFKDAISGPYYQNILL